jgi:hypothetical protein
VYRKRNKLSFSSNWAISKKIESIEENSIVLEQMHACYIEPEESSRILLLKLLLTFWDSWTMTLELPQRRHGDASLTATSIF